jgi:1,4-alpha-glucan branching enzyme
MTESPDPINKWVARDPGLKPFASQLNHRREAVDRMSWQLTGGRGTLSQFALGHLYFGLHQDAEGWVFREWAPNASAIFLIGEISDWEEQAPFALTRIDENGAWELQLPTDALVHGMHYRLRVYWPGGSGDRIPAWTRRVVQDPHTLIFNAQVWAPEQVYVWRHSNFVPPAGGLYIYEAHVGMALEAERVGTWQEFAEQVLPRIVHSGYNTLQLMAVQEHPYYASFGYQVSSFFAPSSRFGTPEELKALVDRAHEMGLAVIMDLIHSHAVANEVEGISNFDGSGHQYFHAGDRGRHPAWDSRCFDYGKPQVLHFLLSNCRYWLDEFRVDGFRFDGVTSMLYHHHGLGKAFTHYGDYFGEVVDEAALTYLALANRLIKAVSPRAITIAEDVSGMPGLALPARQGGVGFDYRFAMGVPDYWIKIIKERDDYHWHMGELWYELTNRRPEERTISYAESHDQALVGDQTLIFRLAGADLYHAMRIGDVHLGIDRAMALHKLIRLITLATAGHGYLNFMGNEFGHPEWIDFPRQGNNWSYHHARRQWHLLDDPNLRYGQLARFDRAMLVLARQWRLLETPALQLLEEHNDRKILIFGRGRLLLAFNFHPQNSYADLAVRAAPGAYDLVLDSDQAQFGGYGRIQPEQVYFTLPAGDNRNELYFYLPSRTALVMAARQP